MVQIQYKIAKKKTQKSRKRQREPKVTPTPYNDEDRNKTTSGARYTIAIKISQ